jgi:predicted acyltransferase
MQYNQLRHERILSIDAFRGITILVMIFVNELAGMRGIPAWMEHMPADADAMSFVDVVFPAFLFIVGMSIPFAINSRLAKGDSFLKLQEHILFRSLGLLALGFFLVNAEGGYNEQAMGVRIEIWALLFFAAVILIWKIYRTKNKILVYILKAIGVITLIILACVYKGENGEAITPRWWGILGLIGWAYLYSCIFYQLFRGNKLLLAGMIAVCIAFYILGKTDSIENSGNWDWISAQAANAAHTSIVLCGVVLTLIFFDETKRMATSNRFIHAGIFTALLFIAGYFLRPYYFISKIHATPTWCLYSAGACCIIFAFLYWLTDLKQIQRWTKFFQPAASNPLLTYILPDIIFYLTGLLGVSLLPDNLSYGWPGILWSALFAVVVMYIVILLNKIHLQLKL